MSNPKEQCPTSPSGDSGASPQPSPPLPRGDSGGSAQPKRLRTKFLRAATFLLVGYVLWCISLYLLQDWLVFPSSAAPPPLPGPPRQNTVILKIPIEDNQQVEAWFIPHPGGNADHPAPVVIFFHGNGELIDYQDDIVDGYHRLGWSVLLPEYRSYGRSGGRPSQDAIRSDAVRFYDILVHRPDVDPNRIVFHGRSLGGAIAADLTTERLPAALILQSTFSSMPAMAHRFLLPAFVSRHAFHTDNTVEQLDIPILIFHGIRDRLVPIAHARRLADLAPDAEYVEFPCGHNDLPGIVHAPTYWNKIVSLLHRARLDLMK